MRYRSLPLLLTLQAGLAAQTKATVPFVGCRSEGMANPIDAPVGKPVTLPISPASGSKLAYFSVGGNYGILAPRGWNCLGTYGSSGGGLTVGRGPLGSRDDLPAIWSDGSGPVVEIHFVNGGGGSGAGIAAPVLARLFPAYRVVAEATLRDYDLPVPSGPYPTDHVVYKTKTLVEFQTPPQTDGLGTFLTLKKSAYPIDGAVILLNEKPDVAFIFVRLPPGLRSLASTIIRQAEIDSLKRAGN